MNRSARSLVLLLCFLICMCTPALAAGTVHENDAPVAEDVSANAWAAILLDMDTGQVLYEKDADEQNYPASTTKIMTAYLCLKYGDPKDEVTVTSHAFSDLSAAASTGGLKVGETMTVHRLLQALLVVSASEAANVVGDYISGTHEEFVDLMNEEAEALGCTGTHFANCHGLPNSDHYTTARDLAIIAQAAMEYEEFRDIVGSATVTMEATNMTAARTVVSTNGILPGSRYPEYNYPYAIGIKTGHTSVAGYCLVSAADKEGTRLLCVVMGTSGRLTSFAETIKLFDWGYDNYDLLTYGQEPEADPFEGAEAELEEAARQDAALEEASLLEEEPVPTATPTPTLAPTPTLTPAQTLAPAPTPLPEDAGSDFMNMLPMICIGIAIFLAVVLVVVIVVVIIKH